MIDQVGLELVKDFSSTVLLMAFLIGAVRYLQKRNDQLVEKLEISHADREEKLMQIIKEVNEKHEGCNEKYFELANKWSEVANDLKNAIEKFSWTKNQ